MNDSVNLNDLNKSPFVVNNQVYVLGNPVVTAQTLDRLVYILDQIGAQQPVVIINPEAQTIPGFEQKLANLIQNNRTVQPQNHTTLDKYRFKDMTDRELYELAVQDKTTRMPPEMMLEMYKGLRARAQALYELDCLSKERDVLWAAHCANPASSAGSERFAEIHYKLIPEAQARYENISMQLQKYDETAQKTAPAVQVQIPNVAATSSVSPTVIHTQEVPANVAANTVEPQNSVEIQEVTEKHKLWGPWQAARYKVMPLSVAQGLAKSASYSGLQHQQKNVEFEGKVWEAVDPAYLLMLGIRLIPDGVPVVYTDIGTFKRVGKSNVPLINLDYWYPKPKGA